MASQGENSTWNSDQLQRRLQAMDDFDFEHLVADLWREQGWEAEVEQQSGDAGVDVRATMVQPYNRKALIQAKRYSDNNPVGGPDIQQYSALKQQESDVDEAIIVTTGRFTGSAEDRASDLNVKAINGQELVDLIESLDAYSVVEEYVGLPEGGGRTPRAGRDPDADVHIDSGTRRKLEEIVGQDLDRYLKDEQYRATRAMEKAKGRVKLNPHDAKVVGVFEDVPGADDFERSFVQNKEQLVVYKEDAHIDEDGIVYIEDLTNYITSNAIKGDKDEPIIGIIERGVQDKAWMSEEGEAILKAEEYKTWTKEKVRSVFAFLENLAQDNSATHAEKTRHRETNEVPVQGNTVEETIEKDAVKMDSTRTIWFYGAAAGTSGWLLLWASFILLPNFVTGFHGLIMLASWIGLPVAIFKDSRQSGFLSKSGKRLLIYVGLSLVPLLALFPGAAYLYRRENTL